MIDTDILNKENLSKIKQSINNADPILLEKVIRSLLLLEGLSQTGENFIFKGGTAVMLLLENPRRFSIDIDIVTENPANIISAFDNIVKQNRFVSWKEDIRTTRKGIDKNHFKFQYKPVMGSAMDIDSVLMDIVVMPSVYEKLQDTNISLPFLPQIGETVLVKTPDVDGIIGDKLTAFAPETTGIPYKKSSNSMSMEIIKQLYDIGCLFENAANPGSISSVFHTTAKAELAQRDMKEDTEIVLQDIFETSLCISTRGQIGQGNFPELANGIRRIGSFIFSEKYHIEKAIIHAAKSAYLSSIIKSGIYKIERFTNASEVVDLIIEDHNYTKLNKLKKSNPEAFFYWYKALQK